MGDFTMCSAASASAAGRVAAAADPGFELEPLASCVAAAAACATVLRRIELQPKLQVAAVDVEFGYLVLLQKLDQQPQIFNVLLFHSIP
jgi:hypothetical protein